MADDGRLTIDELQRQVLLQQISLFAQASTDPQAYDALRDAVSTLEIPAALVPRLEAILEVSLSGDRLRRTSGPGAQLALSALFQKTPRGRTLAAEVSSLNQALAKLTGQRLTEISTAQRGPGTYTLTVATENCRVVIRFEPAGLRIESLEVGLE